MCQPSRDHCPLALQLHATCTRSLLIPILSLGEEPKAWHVSQDRSPTPELTHHSSVLTLFLRISQIQSLLLCHKEERLVSIVGSYISIGTVMCLHMVP